MSETKGHCKHGEFDLLEGCPQCIADKKTFNGAISELETGQLAPETSTALATLPGSDELAMTYYTEALRLQEYAESRIIATIEDAMAATNDLSSISKLKKAMEEKRREYLDPLRAQAEAIRETYSTLMDPILSADKITRTKMTAFDTEQRRIRAEQEEINRLRMEAAQKQMNLEGELSEPVNLVKVDEAPKLTRAEQGTSGMVASWKWEVFDFTLLDDAYKLIDGSQLTAIARKHHDQKQVAGVRFYNEPIIAVRTK